MNKYFFHLGNTPELSITELESVMPKTKITSIHHDLVMAELESDDQASTLMQVLGGTVKIMKMIAEKPGTSPSQIEAVLAQILFETRDSEDKVHFSVAELGRDHLPVIDIRDIKNELKNLGLKSRYVEGSRRGLSASVLLHTSKVREIFVIQTSDSVFLAETIAIQNIDEWSKRDRSKPYADRRKGMLAPKVARMMINLAIGEWNLEGERIENPPVILDPFCGTGTILIEGLIRDCSVIGADLDQEAVEGSRQNLSWLEGNYEFSGSYQVLKQDATKITLPNDQKADYLITEPFLGKPKPNPAKLPYIFRGLEKLYLGAFKNWTKILNPGAQVVIVFPKVIIDVKGKEQVYSLSSLIDKLSKLGYTTRSQPILYHRPQAVVQREIYRFTYQKPEL